MQNKVEQEIEQLIQYSIGFADEVLKKYGEFYPFASLILLTGELVPLGIHSGEEFPDSSQLVLETQELLEQRIDKGELIAYAMAIDTQITNEQFPQSIDAICIRTFHTQRQEQVNYYFPYQHSNERIEIMEGWGEYAN